MPITLKLIFKTGLTLVYMLAYILLKLKSIGELERPFDFETVEMDFLSPYPLRNHPKQLGYCDFFFFETHL